MNSVAVKWNGCHDSHELEMTFLHGKDVVLHSMAL